jgi:hypothetical protein
VWAHEDVLHGLCGQALLKQQLACARVQLQGAFSGAGQQQAGFDELLPRARTRRLRPAAVQLLLLLPLPLSVVLVVADAAPGLRLLQLHKPCQGGDVLDAVQRHVLRVGACT